MLKQSNQLSRVLLQSGALAAPQVEQLLQERQRRGGRLIQILLERNLLSEEQLVQIFHKEMRLPVITLEHLRHIPPTVFRQVPVAFCEAYDVFSVAFDPQQGRLRVAMSDPSDSEVLQELQRIKGMHIDPAVASTSSIRWAIRAAFYGESREWSRAPEWESSSVSSGGSLSSTGASGYRSGKTMSYLSSAGKNLAFQSQHDVGSPVRHRMDTHSGEVMLPSLDSAPSLFPPKRESHSLPLYNSETSYLGSNNSVARDANLEQEKSPAIAVTRNTEEKRMLHLLQELQALREELKDYKAESERQLREMETLNNNRLYEHRMMMRGLFDLLVARGYFSKDELVQMISAIRNAL